MAATPRQVDSGNTSATSWCLFHVDALVKSLLHVCSEHAVASDGGLPVTPTGMKQNRLGVRPLLVRAEGREGCH